MRSLVAGPVTVHSIDPLDSSLVLDSFGVWIDRLGFVVRSSSGTHPSQLYAVQLDGAAIRIGGQVGPGAATPWALGWSPTVGTPRPAVVWFAGYWQELELPSCARRTEISSGTVSPVLTAFGVMQTRMIRAGGTNRIFACPLAGGSDSTEFTFASLPGGTDLEYLAYAGQVGGHHRWWAGSRTTGFVCLYDATAMIEVSGHRTKLGAGFKSMGYSVKHDIFIVHRFESSEDHLYVYANEPVATAITAPTFAGAVKCGEVPMTSITITNT